MPSNTLIPRGDRVVARICDGKWPRLMSINAASAYVYLTSGEAFLRIPEYAALVRGYHGKELVDRFELDALLDRKIAEIKK